MGLFCTVSGINGDFRRKSQFSHPGVFNVPLKGFHLEFGTGVMDRKTKMTGYQLDEKVLR